MVRGSASLALSLGLSPLVIGLTIVAFGTSGPELVVGIKGALSQKGNIIVGNIVGSNICNIGLIMGIAALIQPVQVKLQLLRFDVPIMLSGSILMTVFLVDNHVGRIEGLVLVIGIILYVGLSLQLAKNESKEITLDEYSQKNVKSNGKIIVFILQIIGGCTVLVIGGYWLLDGAEQLALNLGVSEAVIGLTIVAVGTSFPELAIFIMASIQKQSDIAIGNIIGSNIFNILCVLGISSLVSPLDAQGINPVDFVFMIFMAALALPMMRSGFVLRRWEGGVFLLIYVFYLLLISTSSR